MFTVLPKIEMLCCVFYCQLDKQSYHYFHRAVILRVKSVLFSEMAE